MSHRGTQSRLTSLPMLTTRQQCLFLCDMFFRRMCMRICYVHFCCQPAPQLQNYSSLWMITYQENWTGHFLSVYAWTERLPWPDGFVVSLLGSKRSLLNVSLRTVSSIEKCWLAEKRHLNLTTFCRMWLKLSTTLMYMPLTQVCSCSSVRRWTQSTHVFSYTQKWDGFLKADHWPEFLRATPEVSFRKTVTTFQWHIMGRKTCLLVWHIQPAQRTQSVTSGENDNCVEVGR